MKSENIMEALNGIDHELVEDAEEKHKKSPKRLFLKWGAVAACLVLVAGLIWEALAPPKIPISDHAIYSAEDIANMFDYEIAGPTSSYKKIYVADEEYLLLNPIPDSKYLTVYNYLTAFYPGKALDKKELADFIDSKLPEISQALNITLPDCSITGTLILDADVLSSWESSMYGIGGTQYPLYNKLSITGGGTNNPTGAVYLNGQRLEINQSQSDAEILASLEGVKETLFSIFQVSFTDAKIVRNYERDSNTGASDIRIYFYNNSDHPLNAEQSEPLSDHIRLYFDNIQNSKDDVVSDTVIWDVGISYIQYRQDPLEIFSPIVQAKAISLEEAEALLVKGYVFGGHSCPVCMEGQKKVDFSEYDFVGLEYVYGKIIDDTSQLLPFYAFYKEIGISENGNKIFAKTYVPAIKVSGYEEYFKSQEAKHKNS